MELIYLWVEDYKNIHKQGFNFSPKFQCEFNHPELIINEKDNDISDFFGENINVTAIVGKNGSGKSAILEIIQKILIYDPSVGGEEPDCSYLLIIQLAQEKIIITNTDHNEIPKNFKALLKERGEVVNHISPLFLDSELPYNRFNEYNFVSDGFAVIPDFERIKENVYIDLEFSIICKKLLVMMEKGIKLFPFYNFEPVKIIFDPDHSNLEKNKNQLIYEYHKKGLFNDLIEDMDSTVDSIYDAFDLFVFKLFIERQDDSDDLNRRLTEIQAGHEFGVLGVVADSFEEEIREDIFLLRDSIYSKPELLITENNTNNPIIEVLKRYIDYFEINLIDANNRSYQNLSHGEKKFFGMDVSIFYKVSHFTDLHTYFFLGFDEPELGLHPEWQRKYISSTIRLLKKLNKNFHLFVTSHSPFLLSDLPKEFIVFLIADDANNSCKVVRGVDEGKQTFGANIHTLLSDSFFMGEGLMGEFAKEKIETIIKFLRSKSEEVSFDEAEKIISLKEAEKIINVLGEPILKRRLETMLDKFKLDFKKKTDTDIKNEIDKHEKQIQELKKKINEND